MCEASGRGSEELKKGPTSSLIIVFVHCDIVETVSCSQTVK